jgi:hypothetical protein
MIACDNCGLQYLEWGRDEMCPRCKHNVKELDEITALRSALKVADAVIVQIENYAKCICPEELADYIAEKTKAGV